MNSVNSAEKKEVMVKVDLTLMLLQVRVEAGDVLYLPSLWFHHLTQSQVSPR